MRSSVHRFAASIGFLVVCAAASASVGSASEGGDPAQAKARDDGSPITPYRATHPGLRVTLWVNPRRIVRTHVLARMRCGDGSMGWGGVEIHGWTGFIVHRNGHFEFKESEGYEGSGNYFEQLSGRVHGNSIRGGYRAWEERLGEEDEGWLPRCGTVSPRSETMRFVARRVSGPPWRPGS